MGLNIIFMNLKSSGKEALAVRLPDWSHRDKGEKRLSPDRKRTGYKNQIWSIGVMCASRIRGLGN